MSNELTREQIEEFRWAMLSDEGACFHFTADAYEEKANAVCDMALRSIPAEPVAYQGWNPRTGAVEFSADVPAASVMRDFKMRPLYTAPPRQPAGELSDERIREIARNHFSEDCDIHLCADAERLDWLETMVVNVRFPLRYGSRDLFWSSPTDDEGEPPGPSDIRAAIDSARKTK